MKHLTDFSELEALANDEARSCTGKQGYRSEKRAANVVKVMQAKRGETYDAYKCRFCKYWHIGHSLRAGTTVNGILFNGPVEIVIKDGRVTVNQQIAA